MFYMSFLNFSKEVASDLTLAEKLNQILTTGVGGYLLVFVILSLIWFILSIFGKIFDKSSKPKVEKKPEQPVQTAVPEPTPVTPSAEDDTAVVAAIVAAISAYTGKPTGGFKVVSFRKKH